MDDGFLGEDDVVPDEAARERGDVDDRDQQGETESGQRIDARQRDELPRGVAGLPVRRHCDGA